MKELLNIINDEYEIKHILDMNNDIKLLNDSEIENNINLLRQIKCSDTQIKNIIITNPYFLSRSINDIVMLIKKLSLLGISDLNLTFDSNPYLLNKDIYEINKFISEKEGMELEDIISLIETGMVD